jgi:cytoskeleton protein RodZ
MQSQSQPDAAVGNGLKAETMPVDVPEPTLPGFDPAAPLPEPAPPAPQPGEILRKAREARGDSLNDVAQILKLSAQQLEALENGRFDVLPGPTFVRGFLRNYARYLGISPDPLLEGVSTRVPTTADLTSMLKLDGNVQPAARPRPQAKMSPVWLIVFVALALAGLAYAGIRLHWFKQLRFDSPAAAPASGKKIQLKQQIVKLEAPEPVPLAPESAYEPPQMEAEQAGASPVDAGAIPVPPAESTLRLLFNASTSAQVRDSSGKLIFTRTGTKGSSSSVKGKPPFSVMVKQAGNVTLEFDGQVVDLKAHTTRDGVARLILQ